MSTLWQTNMEAIFNFDWSFIAIDSAWWSVYDIDQLIHRYDY